MDTSTDHAVGATNSASSTSSPPNSANNQLANTLADDVAAATSSQHHDAEADAFLAALNIDSTTNASTQAAQTPNEGNAEGATAATQAGEESARTTGPKRQRAFDFFDLSNDEKRDEGGDEKRAKHA